MNEEATPRRGRWWLLALGVLVVAGLIWGMVPPRERVTPRSVWYCTQSGVARETLDGPSLDGFMVFRLPHPGKSQFDLAVVPRVGVVESTRARLLGNTLTGSAIPMRTTGEKAEVDGVTWERFSNLFGTSAPK